MTPLSENILIPGGRVPGPSEYGGPDHAANIRRMKETNNNPNQDLCDRLAAAAKERGRPLTPTEYALVAQGKPLPPVVKKNRVTEESRIAELEKTVAELKAAVESLTPPSVRGREVR